LVAQMQTYLPEVDVVLLSDYGKGTLVDPLTLIQLARAAGKPVLVDPKGHDFSKYCGATLITPNLAEFEAVVGHCATLAQLVERGEHLRTQLALEALLITRGEHGMTLLQQGQAALHLSAQAREVFDVTGAGDTVIGVLAAGLAAHQDLVQATMLANLAAGLVVAKLGAATVSVVELEQTLRTVPAYGAYDAVTLQSIVRAAKARGEKVVMTNGCFDILHAGHIHYLAQARQLGNRLLVAVNDDASVRRLKGSHRPVNPLAQRMAVLSALACVDWVVPFAEDTPAELICQLLPDVLVKGGDYRGRLIAGSEYVLANGGQVFVLDFVEGYSTTAMLASLQRGDL
ncbi:MAG: bifunctional heptose 7-phosphate kinase/heptose 1-phosphate adenyltransferase, partial [Beggiatoa sp. IS2]